MVVTHDLESAAQACDRLVLVAAGAIVASGRPEDVLTRNNTLAAFGVAVVARRENGTLRVVREPSELRRTPS